MPKKNRSKKQAARAKQRATGAPYTAAAGGTGHRHSAPDFGVMDSRLYGVTRQVSLAPAAALVGAARAGCRPCQDSAIPALVTGDRLVVANLAGLPFSLLPTPGLMTPASARLWAVARQMQAGGLNGPAPAAPMLAVLEELSAGEVRDVVEDALDLWAALGADPAEFAAAAAPFTGDGVRQDEEDDAEDDLPEAIRPPENPFAGGGMMVLLAEQLADGFPLPMLVQSALAGTVDDEITEYAHSLFETLVERGPGAGREAALLLAQYMLSTGYYGAGVQAAVRYYRQQPPPMAQAPVLTTLHLLVSAFIANGRAGAERILSDDLSPAELDGVVRYLFCICVGMSGYPRERQTALTEELCADVR
ncbi:hypothetical protein [Kitasatospora indigofera]|uniref:hypothetical protein n=1 Tax=Kitasatospora indigofera TaxID=67307 RepID=UPI00369EB8B3